MKNLLLSFTFCFCFLAIGTSQVSFGGGATYLNDFGLQVRANIPMEKLNIIPKVSYYFVENATVLKFDADLAYNVAMIDDDNPLYLFAGPSLYRVSVDFLGTSVSTSEIGLNLGGGVNFSNIYVEAGYFLLFCDGCGGELGFSAGYMF